MFKGISGRIVKGNAEKYCNGVTEGISNEIGARIYKHCCEGHYYGYTAGILEGIPSSFA